MSNKYYLLTYLLKQESNGKLIADSVALLQIQKRQLRHQLRNCLQTISSQFVKPNHVKVLQLSAT